MRALSMVVLLTACGTDLDGPSTDMAPDAGDGMTTTLGYRHYVIDSIKVPASSAEARQVGLDLDADGVVDNQLGNVIATLSTMGVDANATVSRSIDRGETILLARVGTTSFTDAPLATLQTFAGADSSVPPCMSDTDATCRRHLDGSASFTASATPAGSAVTGKFESGMFTGGSGQLVVRIALMGSSPIDLVMLGSRAQLTMTSDGKIGQAKLAGAVSKAEIDAKVIPAVRENLMASVADDCTAPTSPPACGCATGSNGKAALGMFDKSPVDCSITIDEVSNNTIVKALLAPDVEVEGTMALSLGVSATGVTASFTAP